MSMPSSAAEADVSRMRTLAPQILATGVCVRIGSTTFFQQLGAVTGRDGAWGRAGADISAFAGQTVQICIEAPDASGARLVEAGVDDDVKITR
jgi:hypothetical protein